MIFKTIKELKKHKNNPKYLCRDCLRMGILRDVVKLIETKVIMLEAHTDISEVKSIISEFQILIKEIEG